MDEGGPRFDAAFQGRLLELFAWRRDVRRFRREALPEGTVERLVRAACLAPSVGLSEPWRFVLVEDEGRRAAVREGFTRASEAACTGYDEARAARYRRLKLSGLEEAPVQLAVFCDEGTGQGHGLGRHSMPEAMTHSVAGAVTLLWLVARAEGIGLGWVSILEPERVRAVLGVPEAWRLVAYLCLGFPEHEEERPELERLGWESRTEGVPLWRR